MLESKYLGIVLMYQLFWIIMNIGVMFMVYKIIDMGLDFFRAVFFKGRHKYIVK